MEKDKKEILKAKVDYSKTWATTFMLTTFAVMIAHLQIKESDIAKTTLFWTTILLLIGTLLFLKNYDKTHRNYIDFLIGKKK